LALALFENIIFSLFNVFEVALNKLSFNFTFNLVLQTLFLLPITHCNCECFGEKSSVVKSIYFGQDFTFGCKKILLLSVLSENLKVSLGTGATKRFYSRN
jgi:hypothetical protein